MSEHVALVGCGRWGARILRDLLSLGCAVSVVDVSPERRRYATDRGACFTTERVDGLPEIDGAIVATPSSAHEASIEPLLDRDIPLFVEKPLTVDPRSAEGLARLAGDRLFVMDKWRYHPGIELLRDVGRSRELGPVVGLVTERLGLRETHADVDAAWILAPHELSIALEILGTVPVPRAAVGAARDGRITHLSALLNESPWHLLTVSALVSETRREMRLICAEGSAVLTDPYVDHVLLLRPGEEPRLGIESVRAHGTREQPAHTLVPER